MITVGAVFVLLISVHIHGISVTAQQNNNGMAGRQASRQASRRADRIDKYNKFLKLSLLCIALDSMKKILCVRQP